MPIKVARTQLFRGIFYFDLAENLSCEQGRRIVNELCQEFCITEKDIFHFNQDGVNCYIFARQGDLVRLGIRTEEVANFINAIKV